MREPIDDWADTTVSDQVEVFAVQTGKTSGIMGGAAWTVENDPSRIFWVMPTRQTARGIARTRWIPMLRASPSLASLIPHGASRHDFSTYQQQIGNAIIDMVWSNSPAALSSVPARIVILDEVDKFNEGSRREADAVTLAQQRTKSFSNPKRVKTSTPTLIDGLIWQEFLKTDQRRRLLPCPHCGRHHPASRGMTLIWSKQFTVFKLLGNEACMTWDREAKRIDGSWDLDRVERSARFECPHCGGHIRDGDKTWMDRNGWWQSTAQAAHGYRGRHLSALYASSAESNCGRLAVKFLQAKNSLQGLQGFINGDLAEPYMSQDTLKDRVELISAKLDGADEWKKFLTVDCQATSPRFWYVGRAWNEQTTQSFVTGSADTWEDLRSIQTANRVPDVGVLVDSGFGAMSDAEVYRNCAGFGEVVPCGNKIRALGWIPTKGMPGRKRWKDQSSGLLVPYYLADIDPFVGTVKAGMVAMGLLEFASDFFKDILQAFREGKGTVKWSVAKDAADDVYWHHMDAEIKVTVLNAVTNRVNHVWRLRSKHWPNHLFDCEVMQIVAANFFGLVRTE